MVEHKVRNIFRRNRQTIQCCEELPVTAFTAIRSENFQDVNSGDLSTDQQYLWDICQAVSSGEYSDDLARQ